MATKTFNNDFMRTMEVTPLILSMSLPMVFSMLVNSLYNIVDSFFVARISEDAMTALSLVFPIQNLVHSIAVGFGVGINAVIAFHTGAGNSKAADKAASQGLFLSVLHSLILTVICIAIMPSFLSSFTSAEEIVSMGVRYSTVVFSFTLINLPGITFEKIFQSVGRMKVSMVALASGCIANIILDPLFIFGIGPFPEWGIEGAAFATGLGQLIALSVYLVTYRVRPMSVKVRMKLMKPELKMARSLYSIGIPAALNIALPSVLVSVFNAMLAAYSDTYTLVLGIYYKLQTFLYLPASGFVQGMRPIIGYNKGAGEHVRVRKIFISVLIMCAFIMLFGTVLSLAVPQSLVALFTDNPQTIQIGARAIRIISIGFVVSAISVTASGALEGLGKGMASLWISLCRYIIVIIPVAYLLSILFGLGPDGIWYSFPVAEFLTALASIVIYKRTAES
ncbi:MAG: MATE family efflux transporter [Spirochaetes bacterium]|uniref:Multidrug-efflux transporter n=1 Tax=Candidatus Ornithospirochaeta stercoripullorum TaxID=2840899 RepID=A0A9D9DYV6_9SPIO|nr:MATE family efflux transporter [Candidatus Ornithospirochaeta stercoripullorum]